MAKAKSAPKAAAKKAAAPQAKAAKAPAPKAKAAAPKAKAAAPKAKAATSKPAPKAVPRATPPPDTSAFEAELTERRAAETLLHAELDGVRAQLADVQAQLQVAQTELKLAQASVKERVDAEWASHSAADELTATQNAMKKAERSAEAARAEAAILRGEIDRLRAQLHGKDNRPPTLQGVGVGEPTPPRAIPVPPPLPADAAREEGAPQKAMPQDQTAKTSTDDKPGFWNRIFGGKKEGE
jgi:hypothetical protein